VKYRSRTDIISMILQAATKGATKTRLMYGAFLSHSQLQEYLHFLTERRLITFDEKSSEYKLTDQGLRFLRVYEEISKIVALDGSKASENITPSLLE
jgi:predicted transcriptional regulator